MKPFDDRAWWRQQVPAGGCALTTLARRAGVSTTLARAAATQAQTLGWLRVTGSADLWISLTDDLEPVDVEADGRRVLGELTVGVPRAWAAVQQDSRLSPTRFDGAVRELQRRGGLSVLGMQTARTLVRMPASPAEDDAAILAALERGVWRSLSALSTATGLPVARCAQAHDRLISRGALPSPLTPDGTILPRAAPDASAQVRSPQPPGTPRPGATTWPAWPQSTPPRRPEPAPAARPAPAASAPAPSPPKPRPEPPLPPDAGWRPPAGTVAPGSGSPRFLDMLPRGIALR
jgi:hypothetical protein